MWCKSIDRIDSGLTHSTTVSQSHSYIAKFSPLSTPWVFDDVGVLGPSGQENSVVYLIASTLVQDSTLVVLPVVGHNCDSDWILENYLVDTVTVLYHNEWWNLEISLLTVAVSLNRCVWVLIFSMNSMNWSISQAYLFAASITTSIAPIFIRRAVQNLLLREALEISILCTDAF